MLASLGLFVFDIPTLAFDELQRRATWRWATTPRIGTRDAAQASGPGEETISLEGSVFAEIADGTVSIDQLRAMADAKQAYLLVDGLGYVYGTFAITGIDERRKHFIDGGIALQIDFGLDLLRVDDGNA